MNTDPSAFGIDVPIPSGSLRVAVGATLDVSLFLAIGRNLADTVVELARPKARQSILDFGYGCARVLRHLTVSHSRIFWHGVDIDEEKIAWCQNHVGQLTDTRTCGEHPPLPFKDNSFDCVYLISVFRHLAPEAQLAWLMEFNRIIKDDGLIIVTIYNHLINQMLSSEERQVLRENGVLYKDDGGTPRPSRHIPIRRFTRRRGEVLHLFSCTSIRAGLWGERFPIAAWHERAFCKSLDAVLFRK